MQSTLKRGLYAPETTALQALGSFLFVGLVRSLGVLGQSRRSCCFGSAWVGVRCPMFIANATKRIANPPRWKSACFFRVGLGLFGILFSRKLHFLA